eukprot:gene4324-14435_t
MRDLVTSSDADATSHTGPLFEGASLIPHRLNGSLGRFVGAGSLVMRTPWRTLLTGRDRSKAGAADTSDPAARSAAQNTCRDCALNRRSLASATATHGVRNLAAPLRRSVKSMRLESANALPEFHYQDMMEMEKADVEWRKDMMEMEKADVEWRKVPGDYVSTINVDGQEVLKVPLEAACLKSWRNPEASNNDKFVALELLKNANISAGMILPGCQDTGTAIVMGKRGQYVWTGGNDEEALSKGIFRAYTETNLSQQCDPSLVIDGGGNVTTGVSVADSAEKIKGLGTAACPPYHLAIVIGGFSAEYKYNAKMVERDSTKYNLKMVKLASAKSSYRWVIVIGGLSSEYNLKMVKLASAKSLDHVAIVLGGLCAEYNLKMVKLASTKYLDGLPTTGNEHGRAFRDVAWEQKVLELTRTVGIGAQFGGKYFCHDVRVIRLPRHGASCPVGVGVSCSADRQILGKITKEGLFLEALERNPGQYLPDVDTSALESDVDLNMPMKDIIRTLDAYPIRTRLSLTGTLIVARDIAHAKLQERLDAGEGLPQYVKDHIIYYAGPAKTPEGYASGSFGPTTVARIPMLPASRLLLARCSTHVTAFCGHAPNAGCMDSYVDSFQVAARSMLNTSFCEHLPDAGRMDSYVPAQAAGGSMIMLAKGNRSKAVTDACKQYGGFYLGSIGGPAAILALNCIKKVEVLEYPELGMEAIWKIEVEDFPAFIVVDNKGNDFFKEWQV